MSGRHNNKPSFRLFFLVACLALLPACKQAPSPLAASSQPVSLSAPAWYARQQIDAPGYWTGFGDALTLEQAKARARADLAATFRAEIRSSLRIDKNFSDETLEQRAQSRIEQFASASFDDLRTLKSEESGGRYYLALGYDHRPLHRRLMEGLMNRSQQLESTQQLPATSQLRQHLRAFPDFAAALQLHHQRGRYLLTADGESVVVRDDEIELLLPRPQSDHIGLSLDPPLSVYPPETLFKVELKTARQGYLNYVQVFGNGETVLMFSNRFVLDGEEVIYPDPKQYDGLVTELPFAVSSTRVQHLAVLCPDERELSRMEPVSARANERYRSFLLGEWDRLFAGCEGLALPQVIRR